MWASRHEMPASHYWATLAGLRRRAVGEEGLLQSSTAHCSLYSICYPFAVSVRTAEFPHDAGEQLFKLADALFP